MYGLETINKINNTGSATEHPFNRAVREDLHPDERESLAVQHAKTLRAAKDATAALGL